MGFGKAKTGVPDDAGDGWTSAASAASVPLQQRRSHILDNIPVVGELVHGAAVAAACISTTGQPRSATARACAGLVDHHSRR